MDAIRSRPGSLRWRLVSGAVLAGALFSAVFGVLATWRADQLEDSAVHSALRARLSLVRDQVRPDGSLVQEAATKLKTDLVQVIGPDGAVRSATPALGDVVPLVAVDRVRKAGPSGVQLSRALQRPDMDVAALAVPVTLRPSGSSPAGTGALVVGLDAEGFLAARQQLTSLLTVGLVAVILAMGALAWLLAGRALRTVTALTEEAEAVSVSDVDRGLPVPADDAELARLVSALNRMLSRLHQTYARHVAFANDASHQLRTPLTTLRAEAELALTDGSAAGMRTALVQVMSDADHLADIIDRMLAAAGGPFRAVPTAVGETVEGLARHWSRQAAATGLRLRIDVRGHGDADPRLLAAALDPLVENAIRHTHVKGEVSVAAEVGADDVTLVVVNDGDGVAADLRSRIFEPWVSGGGTPARGLGLWLARETARAAGGDVELTDPSAGHTTFCARLPLASPLSQLRAGTTVGS